MALSKAKIRYTIIGVLGLFFYTLLLTGVSRAVFREPNNGKDLVGTTISNLIVGSSDVSKNIRLLFSKHRFLIVNEEEKDGFTYYSKEITSYPKLLISFKEDNFNSKIQLLDIKTGKLIKEWVPNSKLISKLSYNEDNPKTFDKGSDLHFTHPLMLKDSSVVFQTGYSLVKINTSGEIEWVNKQTPFHHSIEMDSDGNIFGCGIDFSSDEFDFLPDKSKLYSNNFQDDLILKIDASTGKIVYTKSVLEILDENGYLPLIYNDGVLIHDPIHLNDVQPALSDSPNWKKGDLLISCRNLSLVFLFRPSSNKILWLRQGPWIAQHDPDFYKNNKVVVFGNDVIFDYSKSGVLKERSHLINENNEIYVYNFETDSITTPFSRFLKNERVKTASQGRSEILANGDIFVEETNEGRIIIGDSINKKAVFVRRIDPGHITELKWSRLIY